MITATQPPRLPHARAKIFAEQIVIWMQPYVTRAEIAGSIRRRLMYCGDIDIVCIPKLTRNKTGLFETDLEVENTLRTFLIDYVTNTAAASWSNGKEPAPYAKNLLLQLPRCQLDLWCSNEEKFATRLLCRTGSKEHNIWLASRFQHLGLHWNPYEGVSRAGIIIPTATEEEIYALAKLPFIAPENRESEYLVKTYGEN